MARTSDAPARAAEGANGEQAVRRLVNRGDGGERAAAGWSADAEAIGREQQRRAVAYGRSRGQL